jgi:hypothetical protein
MWGGRVCRDNEVPVLRFPTISQRAATIGLLLGTLSAVPIGYAFVHYVLTPWQLSNCEHATASCPPGTIGKAGFEGNALWSTCRVECIPIERLQSGLVPPTFSSTDAQPEN